MNQHSIDGIIYYTIPLTSSFALYIRLLSVKGFIISNDESIIKYICNYISKYVNNNNIITIFCKSQINLSKNIRNTCNFLYIHVTVCDYIFFTYF